MTSTQWKDYLTLLTRLSKTLVAACLLCLKAILLAQSLKCFIPIEWI